jgi:hypothetical protein
MFEKASRLKLRFPYFRGVCNVEDLWDLPVEELDKIYQTVNQGLRCLQENSLLEKNNNHELLELKVDILKYIVIVKMAEKEDKENELVRKEQKRQIDEIIAKKENAALEGKTIDELKALKDSL